MRAPIIEYFVGESLPNLKLWVTIDRALVSGFATDYTFQLQVWNPEETAILFTKTSGFNGQEGDGTPPTGTPNLIIEWAESGELDQLTPARSHKAVLTTTRVSDGRFFYAEYVLRANGLPGEIDSS